MVEFRRIQVERNVHLSVQERVGDSDATCIILHGTADGAYIWDEFIPTLPADLHLIVPDLRGHGASDWDTLGRYTFETHVRDIVKVIKTTTMRRLVLVGHSLGGGVATYLAPALADKLAALVVVDSGPGFDPQTVASVASALRRMCRDYCSIDEYVERLQEDRILASVEMLRKLAREALVETEQSKYRLRFDPGVIDLLENHRDDSWWLPSARAIVAPTLVVRGQASGVLSPASASVLLKSLRRGQLAVVPGAGHAVMTDNPAGFAKAVAPFIHGVVQSEI